VAAVCRTTHLSTAHPITSLRTQLPLADLYKGFLIYARTFALMVATVVSPETLGEIQQSMFLICASRIHTWTVILRAVMCSILAVCWSFGGIWCLHRQGRRWRHSVPSKYWHAAKTLHALSNPEIYRFLLCDESLKPYEGILLWSKSTPLNSSPFIGGLSFKGVRVCSFVCETRAFSNLLPQGAAQWFCPRCTATGESLMEHLFRLVKNFKQRSVAP
jgi:hypothetical protein